MLMKHGANVEVTTEGFTVFHVAALVNDVRIMHYLLKYGGQRDISALADMRRDDLATKFKAVNHEFKLAMDRKWYIVPDLTPFHIACDQNSMDMCNLLIEYGADPVYKPCEEIPSAVEYLTFFDYAELLECIFPSV